MAHPVCFYLPTLHSVSAPQELPPHVLTLPCERALHGSRQTAQADALLTEEEQAVLARLCSALPLPPAHARATLEEMMRLSDTTSDNAFLARIRQKEDATLALEQKEKRELELFAESGAPLAPDAADAEADAERQRRARIDSQKMLLLAYELEAHTLAIAELEAIIATKNQSLQTNLSDGDALADDAEDGLPLVAPAVSPSQAETGMSWRLILEAALAFTPPETIFYTQDSAIIAELSDLGDLLPLTGEEAARYACFDLPSRSLKQVRLPGWQLAGRRAAEPHRPWLHAATTLLVAVPCQKESGISGGAV